MPRARNWMTIKVFSANFLVTWNEHCIWLICKIKFLSSLVQSNIAAPLLQNVTSTTTSAQQSTTPTATVANERGIGHITVPIDSEQPINISRELQLLQFKLLKFTGRLKNWPTFWNTFEPTSISTDGSPLCSNLVIWRIGQQTKQRFSYWVL